MKEMNKNIIVNQLVNQVSKIIIKARKGVVLVHY